MKTRNIGTKAKKALDSLVLIKKKRNTAIILAGGSGERAGGDYTLSGAAFGFGGLDELKRQLSGRARLIYRTYIYGLDACSPEEKQQLWEHYKPNYERLLCRVTGE